MRSSLRIGTLMLMLAACIAVVGLAGCSGSSCTRNSDCRTGMVCGEVGLCASPPDLGDIDGGATLDGASSD